MGTLFITVLCAWYQVTFTRGTCMVGHSKYNLKLAAKRHHLHQRVQINCETHKAETLALAHLPR